MTHTSLAQLRERLLNGLSSQVLHDGTLRVPADQPEAPSDHYAQLCLALALYLHDPGDPRSKALLDGWLQLPSSGRGHLPFNRLILLLWRDCLGQQQEAFHSSILAGLERCPVARVYPSNNWSLLAQLCQLLEARETARQKKETSRFVAMLERWTTPKGGFIDYPAGPAPGGKGATPAAYHHKALLLATLAAWHLPREGALLAQVRRLLDWIGIFDDGEGFIGGYGRSNHALFGDGCLLTALNLLGQEHASTDDDALGALSERIIQRLSAQWRDDNLLWLNPAGSVQGEVGWDNYMHLIVYNAWAGALLMWSARVAQRDGPLGFHGSAFTPMGVDEDAEAGLARIGATSDFVWLFSTTGQPPQAFSRTEAEFRYAGGLPFHARHGGRVLLPSPGRCKSQQLRQEPSLAGWTPVLLANGRLFALTDFHRCIRHETSDEVSFVLEGVPMELTRPCSQGLGGRLLAALDWRVLKGRLGRRAALKRAHLQGVKGTLQVSFARGAAAITAQLELDCIARHHELVLLNPGGHAFVTDNPPIHRKVSWRNPGGSMNMAAHNDLCFTPIPSAIPHAMGAGLPAIHLQPGRTRVCVHLSWS